MIKQISKIVFQPKSKEELYDLINAEIKKKGNLCDLNHIDVSLVTCFSGLFLDSNFNGNISKWDVSGVTAMYSMFHGARFDGDISKWNVSKVENMTFMFYDSNFYGDISSWDRYSTPGDEPMFLGSKTAKKLGMKNPSFNEVKSHFLNLKLEEDLQEGSARQGGLGKLRL